MKVLVRIKELLLRDKHFEEVFKKGASALLVRVFGLGIAFILNVYLARMLGTRDYGLFTLSLTLVTIFSVFVRMGLDVVVMKNIAIAIERKNIALANGYLYTSTRFIFFMAAVVTLISVFVTPSMSYFVFNEPALSSPLGIMIFLLLPLSFVMLVVEALKGLKCITDSVFILNISVPSISLILLVTISPWYNLELKDICSIYVVAFFITAIIAKQRWLVRIQSRKLIKPKIKELLRSGMPLLLVTSGGLIMSWTDTIVLGVFGSVEEVGVYSVASKTALLTSVILFAVNSIAAPKYAALYAKNAIKAMARLARQSTVLLSFLVFIPATIFFVFPEWILGFFGDDFIVGSNILMILTFGQLINVVCGSVSYLLMMSDNEKIVRNIMLTTAFINVFLNVIFIQYYGAEGVAIATAISVSIWNIWMLIVVKNRLGFWTIFNNS